MSNEDIELLKAIRDYKPPAKLHPIAMVAWELYEKNNDTLTPEGEQQLREILESYGDDLKALMDAMEGLTRFMVFVSENEKDLETAEQVSRLLKEVAPKFNPLWEKAGHALQNLGKAAQGMFHRFIDRDVSPDKAAPKYGDERPKNTVPLKDLKPVAQPPPWAVKKGGDPK